MDSSPPLTPGTTVGNGTMVMNAPQGEPPRKRPPKMATIAPGACWEMPENDATHLVSPSSDNDDVIPACRAAP